MWKNCLTVASFLLALLFTTKVEACEDCAGGELNVLISELQTQNKVAVTTCIICEDAGLIDNQIPSDLQLFSNLEVLSLARNNISTFGINQFLNPLLPDLKELNLSKNDFAATIPVDLFPTLRHIEGLDFSEAGELTGTIPDNLGDMLTLTSLRFGSNKLSGTLPASIGDLLRLEVLELNENRLTGTVPKTISRLTRLTRLRIANNALSGTMPKHDAADSDVKSGFVFSPLFDLAKILYITGGAFLGLTILSAIYIVRRRQTKRTANNNRGMGTGFSSWIGGSYAEAGSNDASVAELWEPQQSPKAKSPFIKVKFTDQPTGPPPPPPLNHKQKRRKISDAQFSQASDVGSNYVPYGSQYAQPRDEPSGPPPGSRPPLPALPPLQMLQPPNVFRRLSANFRVPSTNWFSAKYPKSPGRNQLNE